MRAALLLIIVLLTLVAAFAIQNPGLLTVHFLHLSGSTSLLVVIVVAFGTGIIVGLLFGIPASMRRGRRVRELEGELASLRKTSAPPPVEKP
jgi:uncharacterized integral membrane protein